MRERHRERQACRHAGRGQITHKCGSGRVGMRETQREGEAGRPATGGQGPHGKLSLKKINTANRAVIIIYVLGDVQIDKRRETDREKVRARHTEGETQKRGSDRQRGGRPAEPTRAKYTSYLL